MSESLEITEVNRRAFVEKWPPWKAGRLIGEIRTKYEIIYLNKKQNDNKTRTTETSTDNGMEGG